MPPTERPHSHRPLWVAGLGPVCTCAEHFWLPLRPEPVAPAKAATR